MTPLIERPDPPYMQVVRQIRDRIMSGQLREGDRVPSAREIGQEWGIALATATKVLAALRSEGLVRALPGVGTIVQADETTRYAAQDRLAAIRRTGRIPPPGQRAEIKTAEVIPAPEGVADALGIPPETPVIRRHRVTLQHDRPVSSSTSWFDGAFAEVAPRLVETERLPQGTPAYIEECTGRHAQAGRDQVAAAAATDDDARELGVEVGSPVLRGRNWYYDADGVIEYGESVSVSGRWASYDYEIQERT